MVELFYDLNKFLLYFVIGQRINRAEELRLKLPHLLFMSAFALLVDIVLNSFVIYDLETRSVLGIVIDCCFNILSCMLVLYVQLNLIEIKEVEGENRTITRMLRQAQSQYEFHQTNFELINIKCHDIKHAIGAILSKNNFDRAEVEKINDVVSIYDTLVKTGNKALDILLTEKSLVCKNKHSSLVRGRFSDHHKVGFLTISRSVFRLYEDRFSGHQLVGKLYLWHTRHFHI